MLQPRKPQKAARSFDRVNKPEDAADKLRIFGILLQPNQLHIELSDALIGFSQEVAQQIIHVSILIVLGALILPGGTARVWGIKP